MSLNNHEKLKVELQKGGRKTAHEFERLVATLLGRLLDVSIAVACAGSQHGGDVGPAGRQGRRFLVECKKYHRSRLNERELLGEIEQAITRDGALEAWVLVITSEVPKQIQDSLVRSGEDKGIPVLILDWPDGSEVPQVAALCASAPDLVESVFSKEAADAARSLQSVSENVLESLRRDMQSWCLGFEALRTKSHEKLEEMWMSPREARAKFGQDVAGGNREKRVKRASVHHKMTSWWRDSSENESPAAVVGKEGVGKTWATLDWLVGTKEEHPVILTIPSSAVAGIDRITETDVKRFLAVHLHEMTGTRDSNHWLCRLDRLLKRPKGEGPVLTVFLDGLNQAPEPSARWTQIMRVLQGETFAGRLRVIVSTRGHYFENNLRALRYLDSPAERIDVYPFDAEPEGELDRMLELEGLSRRDLTPDMIKTVRNPRFFSLAMRFGKDIIREGRATIHRLLWEYGCDTFSLRTEESFGEAEWGDLMREVANRSGKGEARFSPEELREILGRRDLDDREIYARVSDIYDGQFVKLESYGEVRFQSTIVLHALGTALLHSLDKMDAVGFEVLHDRLMKYLDPISGFDHRSKILYAAVSILSSRDRADEKPVSGVLVTAWLQTQNVPDEHWKKVVGLASCFPNALLDAVERSDGQVHVFARSWAVKALRKALEANNDLFPYVIRRVRRWMSVVSLNTTPPDVANTIKKHSGEETVARDEKWHLDHLNRLVGKDTSGLIRVLGTEIELKDYDSGFAKSAAVSIIEDFPLSKAAEVFETAAIAASVGVSKVRNSWIKLGWLCLLNEVDHEETADMLRKLSESVRRRKPEPGVHPDLPNQVAALLLQISGREEDDREAADINLDSLRHFSYERDYLSNPGRSFRNLERRHVETVLNDTELSLEFRISRTEEMWLDPHFEPPAAFVEEVRAAASAVDPGKLVPQRYATSEVRHFECLEPVLARYAPDLLADIVRRKLLGMETCTKEQRYWRAVDSIDHFLLTNESVVAAARKLRMNGEEDSRQRETIISNGLTLIETLNMEAKEQFETLIEADLEFIDDRFSNTLRVPELRDVDELISRYSAAPIRRQYNLLLLLSCRQLRLSDYAWSWIGDFTRRCAGSHEEESARGVAFEILSGTDPERFGRMLNDDNWSWDPKEKEKVNHYGTHALIRASSDVPFLELAPRLAPWLLLEAVRLRGSKREEVKFAAETVARILLVKETEDPDPGSTFSVYLNDDVPWPVTFSVEPRPESSGEENIRRMFNSDERERIQNEAIDNAKSHILGMWNSGHSLYFRNIDFEDFGPVFEHTPETIDRLLDGFYGPTKDFWRRVRMAEGVFLALCEFLLIHDPKRGVRLWRVLRKTMMTRYVGRADVDYLFHMAFQVPDSPEVDALRRELVELEYCNNDAALFDIVIAAFCNGKAEWINALIKEDRTSEFAWRRRRAIVLEGLKPNNELPVPEAWPEGEIKTVTKELRVKSARQRWVEACAHHWWQSFLKAPDADTAYAAWLLFLRSADRRAETWMYRDIETSQDSGKQSFDRKVRHFKLGKYSMERAFKKRCDELVKEFLGRRIIDGVGPWADGNLFG